MAAVSKNMVPSPPLPEFRGNSRERRLRSPLKRSRAIGDPLPLRGERCYSSGCSVFNLLTQLGVLLLVTLGVFRGGKGGGAAQVGKQELTLRFHVFTAVAKAQKPGTHKVLLVFRAAAASAVRGRRAGPRLRCGSRG